MLGRLVYKPKRSARAAKGGRIISMEDLAKIRYAYLYDPLLVHADPKSLWTSKSAGGKYEMAFGIDGILESTWPSDVLRETILAIALHDAAAESGAYERRRDDSQKYMKGLRFHALALASLYIQCEPNLPSVTSLLHDGAKFKGIWDAIWDAARMTLHQQYRSYVANNRLSLFALKRSAEVWEDMKEDFRFKLRLESKKS